MLLAKCRGAALITALFVMALIAAAATAMIMQQRISIARTEQILTADQAYQYAQVVTDWALYNLKNDLNNKTNPKDVFPKNYPRSNVPQGYFEGQITDLQAKFNINNLSDKAYRDGFTHMLTLLFPRRKDQKAITEAISNWVSRQGEFDIANDEAYVKAGLTYKVPHTFMRNISQLRQVLGINAAIYRRLRPYVTALPTVTKINGNTAPALVLTTLSKKMTLKTAQLIVAARPFANENDFYGSPIVKNHQISMGITTLSHYFLSTSLVNVEQQTHLLSSTIYRNDVTKKIQVMWQTWL